jgi:uncharacterized membrane protein (DUF485 family)
MNSPARTLRIMKIIFIVYALLMVYRVTRMQVQVHPPVNPAFEIAIGIIALLCIVAGFYAPRAMPRLAKRKSPNAPAAIRLKQWTMANVLSMACFLGCIMFGVELRFVGAHNWLIGLLFGAGIAGLLFSSPGAPPVMDGNPPRG